VTVQEHIERLKGEKTPHSTAELDRLGWARQAEIRGELTARHHGSYVMVQVARGAACVGNTPQAAFANARAASPEQAFSRIRIGYKAALPHRLWGNLSDTPRAG